MKKEKSFLMYPSFKDSILELSNESKIELWDVLFAYHENGGIVIPCNPETRACINSMKYLFRKDAEHYEKVVEERAKAGAKGAEVRAINMANKILEQQAIANTSLQLPTDGSGCIGLLTDKENGNGNEKENVFNTPKEESAERNHSICKKLKPIEDCKFNENETEPQKILISIHGHITTEHFVEIMNRFSRNKSDMFNTITRPEDFKMIIINIKQFLDIDNPPLDKTQSITYNINNN